MKKITTVLLSAVIFGFVGCTDTGTTTNQELPNDNNYASSVIPAQSLGDGLEHDITSYFFPYNTLRDGYTYKDYAVTIKNADGEFDNQQRVVKHYVEGNKNSYNESVITVFQNNKVVKRSTVGGSKITDITYDVNDNVKTTEQYFKLLQTGDDLIRNENGACVFKEKLDSFYIENVIPIQADPHKSSTHYNSVLHFYCGTSKGTKIDRYYADGWGEVAEIYTYSDNSMQYVVLDRQTNQEQQE